MKRSLIIFATIIGGLLVGGGAGWAALMLLNPQSEAVPKLSIGEEQLAFVEVPRMIAPLVDGEGQLMGYNRFVVQLQVPADNAEIMLTKIPLVQDAINMRTFRAPMAAGPDGQRPNLEVFRQTVQQAAEEVYGKKQVRRILVTYAGPA